MTQIRNARKVFQFRIEINGVNQFECQKFKVPEVEIAVVEHGDANKRVKSAGMIKIGEATMENIVPTDSTEDWAWNWLVQAQNSSTGTGGLPEDYMDTVIVRDMAPDGVTVLETYMMEEAWISKISTVNRDRMSSDNMIRTLTLQCNDLQSY